MNKCLFQQAYALAVSLGGSIEPLEPPLATGLLCTYTCMQVIEWWPVYSTAISTQQRTEDAPSMHERAPEKCHGCPLCEYYVSFRLHTPIECSGACEWNVIILTLTSML